MLARVRITWLVVALAALLAGCQTAPQRSAIDVLLEAEAMLTAAAQTLGDGARTGLINPRSDEYRRAYEALQDAGHAMDRAWDAYRLGDQALALESRGQAIALYLSLRPTLYRLAGEQP